MFSPFIQLHRLETWLDWRRGKHQSLCHAICTLYKYICKALDYRGQYMFWCCALLCFRYITQGYGCHSLHWVALDNTEGVVCYAVIPLLCGQCTDIRKVSLRRTFTDYDVADVIAFAISSRFYIVQLFLCSIFARLLATVYRVFCKIHSYIDLNMIVKLRLFRWFNPLSYLMHKCVA